MSASLHVVAAQLPGASGPLAQRLDLAEEAVTKAVSGAHGHVDLVVLPEAFLPGYEHRSGDAGTVAKARAWAHQAARRHDCHLAVGVRAVGRSELLLCAPDGRDWTYAKRFPTWSERAVWGAGRHAVIADSSLGRVGLLLCADLVQPPAWADLAGAVDLVVVAAAWPDYRGRKGGLWGPRSGLAARWTGLAERHRDRSLVEGARALGVPVVFANACGPWRQDEGFSGGSRIVDPSGRVCAVLGPESGLARATVQLGGTPAGGSGTPRSPLGWRAFAAVYRGLTRLRR